MIKAKVFAGIVFNSALLASLASPAQAEGWFSRLITGATSSDSVAASGVYAEHCGSCHIAYRPQLLPAASWERLISATADHFGESLSITPKQAAAIRNYLLDNGAGRTPDPLAARIMAAQGGEAWPVRVTEMVFFRQHHQELQSAGDASKLGRCELCHAGAERGEYAVTNE
jgi:hypothetical protein